MTSGSSAPSRTCCTDRCRLTRQTNSPFLRDVMLLYSALSKHRPHLPFILLRTGVPPAGESVKDGVRHEERARQTRDAKRVRFAQQVGETKRPPHPDTAPGSDSDSEDERPTGTGFAAISSPPPVSVPSGSHPVRSPPIMAPPPPRQRPLPPPPPSAASEGAAPPMTPVSASGRMVPPSAPERPTKRVLPAEFSPTGDGSPRTRQSSSSGVRLTLVDGKGKPAKQRITFKEPTSRSPASSDWEELF